MLSRKLNAALFGLALTGVVGTVYADVRKEELYFFRNTDASTPPAKEQTRVPDAKELVQGWLAKEPKHGHERDSAGARRTVTNPERDIWGTTPPVN